MIKKVDLYKYRNVKVSKLSGGQKQRVAIARALAKDTPIIMADEPTGSLDSKSATMVIELLRKIATDKLVVIVTHNYEQVSDYVTRKITMHDGKILEDKVIKKIESNPEANFNHYKNISFISKLRIGMRNAFNVLPKFLLVSFVYLFIIFALINVYAFFRKQEYIDYKNGYNYYFQDASDNRIVIKKSDGSVISTDDYSNISKLSNVKKIVKSDYLIDMSNYLTDDKEFYFTGSFNEISELNKVDVGELAHSDDEIVLGIAKDNYYARNVDNLIGKKVFWGDDSFEGSRTNYVIVGVKYIDKINSLNYYQDGKLYGTSKLIDNLRKSYNYQNSKVKVLFQDKYYDSHVYDASYAIIANANVKDNEVYISSDLNGSCKNENCVNSKLKIEIENNYYKDSLEFNVTKTYNSKNFSDYLGLKDFENYRGAIFISNSYYDKIFMKDNYQSSVYVNDVKNVDEVADNLKKLGFQTLKIKDTLVTDRYLPILQLVRTFVISILVIALFFISYFVIRIILKSRNVYFSTIRILGSSQNVCKSLLKIELLTVSNLMFFLSMLSLVLQHYKYYSIAFIDTILKYLDYKDYLILYVIITLMSYLISVRFSRRLFKNSAMKTIREEV